jgi:TPR repeat protein
MCSNMCRPLFAIALLFLTHSSTSQTIQRTPNGGIVVVQMTSAANGDRDAKTPEQIAAVNKKLATEGNTEAAYQLGLAYMQGLGVSQNLKLAEHWYEIGATTPAQKLRVANQYRSGQYFHKDLQAAVHWYESAADSAALFELARMYQLGQLRPDNLPKAIDNYLRILKDPTGAYFGRAEMELGNLVLDGKYTSHDPSLDLRWSRIIAQELIGQEQYKLAFASGSAMDLPGTPEVGALVIRTAASYNVDLAQGQMAEADLKDKDSTATVARGYAWLKLASKKREADRPSFNSLASQLSPSQFAQGESVYNALEQTRSEAGAYYEENDPLRAPDFAVLQSSLEKFTDPDEQLRLAFHFELNSSDPAAFAQALRLYRVVRDQRVSSVRLKIGTQYLLGLNGFPKNTSIAAKWYSFAANAGSAEACRHLADLYAGEALPSDPVEAAIWSKLAGKENPEGEPLTPQQQRQVDERVNAWRAAHPKSIT